MTSPLDTLRRTDAVCAGTDTGPAAVRIVAVVTGWTDQEAAFATRLAATRDALLDASWSVSTVIVQNAEGDAPDDTRRYCARLGVGVVCCGDTGFAAANRLGVRVVDPAPTDFLLFTQADARFGADAVIRGVALARANGAAVGPSGGYLRGWPGQGRMVVEEYGRNSVRTRGEPAAWVDFVTGYWLLVRADAYARSRGWSSAYHLYYEDCDLCLALGEVSTPCCVDAAIRVDHDRGGTVRRLIDPDRREAIRAASRSVFVRRWTARCGGNVDAEPPYDGAFSAACAVTLIRSSDGDLWDSYRWLDLGAYDGGYAARSTIERGALFVTVSCHDAQAVDAVRVRIDAHNTRSRLDRVELLDDARRRPAQSFDVVWLDYVCCPDEVPPLREAARLSRRWVAVRPLQAVTVVEHLEHVGCVVVSSSAALVLARVDAEAGAALRSG